MVMSGGEDDRRNNFMINLLESMEPSLDGTRNPWIYSQTHYLLCYKGPVVKRIKIEEECST